MQNCTLSRLNPVPPWRSGFKPTQAPSSAALFQYRHASASHKHTAPTAATGILNCGGPFLRACFSYVVRTKKKGPFFVIPILWKVALPSKPLDIPGSASRTSSLRNKRPSTQTKSIDPRAQPLLPLTRKQDDEISALVAMFLVDVSLPWHKTDAESHVDIFLSTSQKRSKTHVVTKSLYIKTWFVCLNNFECLKNVETFQTPKRVPWCLPQICWQR